MTIDPYSTTYWQESPKANACNRASTAGQLELSSSMQPPSRMPLQAKPNGGNSKVMEDFTGSGKVTKVTATASKPAKRMVPAETMDEFKRAIDGSDLTKIALVEALKKKYVLRSSPTTVAIDADANKSSRFPNLPKEAINNTLTSVAARVGSKEKEKRWVLLNTVF